MELRVASFCEEEDCKTAANNALGAEVKAKTGLFIETVYLRVDASISF